MLDRLLHEHASQFQPNLHSLVFDLGKPRAPFRARLFAINVFSKFSSDVGQWSVRGLNRIAVLPVYGSTEEVRADLRSEQVTHA